MYKMKKVICAALCLILLPGLFSCGKNKAAMTFDGASLSGEAYGYYIACYKQYWLTYFGKTDSASFWSAESDGKTNAARLTEISDTAIKKRLICARLFDASSLQLSDSEKASIDRMIAAMKDASSGGKGIEEDEVFRALGIKEKDLTGITDQELYDSLCMTPESITEWMKSLSPEQLFSVMEMSTTMRADIMKAAPIYQTLNKLIKDGPAFKARLGIYADKYAPQIIELNKGIDEFYQEFLKKFKDLQPPTEVMNQVNTQTYKEMLQYLTEQNKLFNEIYRVRGSLPKKAQKAQKHVNELTEKYMKELNKLVIERK